MRAIKLIATTVIQSSRSFCHRVQCCTKKKKKKKKSSTPVFHRVCGTEKKRNYSSQSALLLLHNDGGSQTEPYPWMRCVQCGDSIARTCLPSCSSLLARSHSAVRSQDHPVQDGYPWFLYTVFICVFVCLFACLFVCLFVFCFFVLFFFFFLFVPLFVCFLSHPVTVY